MVCVCIVDVLLFYQSVLHAIQGRNTKVYKTGPCTIKNLVWFWFNLPSCRDKQFFHLTFEL